MEILPEFSARASLALMGERFRQMQVWTHVEAQVHIQQKVLIHKPLDKLLDCFINMLAGGQGLVEINTRVRPDRVVQQAFGRDGCAEQSTISDTLDACTAHTVTQLRAAHTSILQTYGQSVRHDYAHQSQLLDVDITGLSAGRLGEGVSKGYFAGVKNQRGRQLGRVLATHYDEIVVDELYDGKRQLNKSLPALVTQAEQVLQLSEKQRQNTIIRVDAGGGEDATINWLLGREYHLLIKMKSWRRAHKLAQSVTDWVLDSKNAEREVGWVTQPHAYRQPTRQVAIRTRKKNGQWSYHVLVFTLTDAMLWTLARQPPLAQPSACELLWAVLHAYDLRGGGLETQHKSDKQGLGLSHRNKRRFPAQAMLVLLAQLAHNFVIWVRNDLAHTDARFHHYGIERTVRDVFQITGQVQFNAQGRVAQVQLNTLHPLASVVHQTFSLCPETVNL